MQDQNRQIFTLSDLGKSLRSVIERNYSSTYWVKAEIAKLNHYPRSGHCYPELVHKTGNIVHAQMRSTIWADDFKQINKLFTDTTGEQLNEGMAILFRASVTFHPVYGLSLQIWEIEPAFTLGELALRKNQNIVRLREEGLFDRNRSAPMPILPKRVAVISVETSKGYNDFLAIIKSYEQRYSVWHFLFPSILQGDKAVEGIISQLRIIKQASGQFDIVAIIRGGGGDIGLSCYDDYSLAREIALCPLPVISGIGHSTNETIAEMVAWANKITPTDVGYFIIEKFRDYELRIENCRKSINNIVIDQIDFQKQKVETLTDKLIGTSQGNVVKQKHLIMNCARKVAVNTINICKHQSKNLENLAHNITIKPAKTILRQKFRIAKHTLLVQKGVELFINKAENQLKGYSENIRLSDPVKILGRGYSITMNNSQIVTGPSKLKKGDTIQTYFLEGTVRSVVTDSDKQLK